MVTNTNPDPQEGGPREVTSAEPGIEERMELPAAPTDEPVGAKPTPAVAQGEEPLPPNLEEAYKKLAAEKKELYDRLLRKQAELENFRKRVLREKEEFLQHANADLIRAMLPVLDGFEQAFKHHAAHVGEGVPQEFYRGLQLLQQELKEVLGRAGLTRIEARGKIFDPHLHQAVERVESDEHRDQEIIEELQGGYKLKHRLLRPAIVKVAVRAAPTPAGGDPED